MYFVEGNIGSGKSTFLKKLSSEFKVVQEQVDEWSKMKNANGKNILEEFYEDPERSHLWLILKSKLLRTI